MSIRACFPLSSSNISRRCKISGVQGTGSLPMLPRALDVAELPLGMDPKLNRLTVSFLGFDMLLG